MKNETFMGLEIRHDIEIPSYDPADLVPGFRTDQVPTVPEKRKPAEQTATKGIEATLIKITQERTTVFRSGGTAYVTVKATGETWAVGSSPFADWLRTTWWDKYQKTLSNDNIKNAAATLHAISLKTKPRPIYFRWANLGDKIYLDLGTEKWDCVEITAKGWRVLDRSPVPFFRNANTKGMPYPQPGGSLELLKPLLACSDEGWTLLKGWLIQAARGTGPFCHLIVAGAHGSVKTTTCRYLKTLIDPNDQADLGWLPKKAEDFGLQASQEYTLAYDNVSHLSAEQSDILCRLATGGGIKKRTLHTNTDQTIFDVRNPVILNGIPDFADRADLVDRTVFVQQPELSDEDRKEEKEVDKRFEEIRPKVLGALLDAYVVGLGNLDIKIPNPPRMADACKWVTACTGSLEFLDTYRINKIQALGVIAEESPIIPPIIKILKGQLSGSWKGTTEELRSECYQPGVTDMNRFPKTARAMGNQIRRDKQALRSVGIEVIQGERSHGKSYIQLVKVDAMSIVEPDVDVEPELEPKSEPKPEPTKTPEPTREEPGRTVCVNTSELPTETRRPSIATWVKTKYTDDEFYVTTRHPEHYVACILNNQVPTFFADRTYWQPPATMPLVDIRHDEIVSWR